MTLTAQSDFHPEQQSENHDDVNDGQRSRRRGPRFPHRGGSVRAMIHRMHFYAGVFVGPFILIAAVTGLLYAAAPSIESIVDHDKMYVPASDVHSHQRVDVTDQIRTAAERHPNLTFSGVQIRNDDRATTRVLFNDPSLPSKSYRRVVMVNPYTGEVVGDTVQFGSSSSLRFREWTDRAHRNLFLGEPGRIYAETAAAWLGVLTVSGLVMWWRKVYDKNKKKRATGSESYSSSKPLTGRPKSMRRHAIIGTWACLGMLFLTATGLTWSKYAGAQIADWRVQLNWAKPTPDTTVSQSVGSPDAFMDHSHHGGHGDHSGHGGMSSDSPALTPHDSVLEAQNHVDTVMSSAKQAGIKASFEATAPAAPGEAWTVTDLRVPWYFSHDSVSVDGETGRVVDTVWFKDWPFAAKLAEWGIQLHMGILFGIMSQVALGALAIMICIIVVRGYMMWWQRRPTRNRNGFRSNFGRAPRRGAWRRSSIIGFAVAAILLIGYGLLAPLFAISALAFLALDIVIGFVIRWKGRRDHVGSSKDTSFAEVNA